VAGVTPHRAMVAGDSPHHGEETCYTGSEAKSPLGPGLEDGELHEQADAPMHDTRTPAPAILDLPAARMPMDFGPPGSFRAKLMETRHKHASMQARNASGACALHTPAILFPTCSRLDFPTTPHRMSAKKQQTNQRQTNTDAAPRRETEDDEDPNPSELPRLVRNILKDNSMAQERLHLLEEAMNQVDEERLPGVSIPSTLL